MDNEYFSKSIAIFGTKLSAILIIQKRPLIYNKFTLNFPPFSAPLSHTINAATEDSLTDVTIENVLTDNLYNDLGFIVGDRLMILVEAQSTWTMNIFLVTQIFS